MTRYGQELSSSLFVIIRVSPKNKLRAQVHTGKLFVIINA